MTQPLVSVILNTARSNFPMIGFPEKNHLLYTIDALKRQSFHNFGGFELIVSDYIHSRREMDWGKAGELKFPIYHVPITHSAAHANGYCAISAGKNNGGMFAEGKYLIFLDDCCSFEKDFIFRIFKAWAERKIFTNALHRKEVGALSYCGADGNQIIDCRYSYFNKEDQGEQEYIDGFHMYGYASMSLEAFIGINGYDEMFDGSRQLEDIECGERLKQNGFHIALNNRIFVNEQEHLEIGRGPEGNDCPWHTGKGDDGIKLKPNLRCNGPYYCLKAQRISSQRMKANMHPLSQGERNKIKPCFKLNGKICEVSGVECNWLNEDGSLKYMSVDDFIYNNPPVFNMLSMRQEKLSIKEGYRVR